MKAEIRTADRGGLDEEADPTTRRASTSSAPTILGVPRTHGFDLLAWVLPFGGIAIGAVGARRSAARHWSRNRDEPSRRGLPGARRPPLDARARAPRRRGARPLRCLRSSRSRSSPGSLSVITPCVLPLVPGYLSAVSAVEVDRLGERGAGRRIVIASMPFIIGFTLVFVALGAGAAAIASVVDKSTQTQIAGFVLVVIGLAFVGLLPWPERARRARACCSARGARGSGAAARRRVRRLRGAVHRHGARVDPRARELERRRSRAASSCWSPTRSGSVPRSCSPVSRSRTRCARSAGCATTTGACAVVSGATLVALGLLLFFNRDWWLRVALDQLFTQIGLGTL